MACRLAFDVLDDVVELALLGFPFAVAFHARPGGLLVGIEAPDDDVTFSARVVVPGGVVGAVTFTVGAGPEDAVEGWFEGGEEDEVVRPWVGSCGSEFGRAEERGRA